MGKIHKPRAGSLQFWPRARAPRLIPSVNWKVLEQKHSDKKLLGFIGYKVGMARVLVQDLTQDSMTKNKSIILPVSIIEVPPAKILAVRFYKDNNVTTQIISHDLDKELKHKITLPKQWQTTKKLEEQEKNLENYKDITLIIYSIVKKTGKKKTPDISEIALGGTIKEKFDFAKQHLGKELNLSEFFSKGQLVDFRGVTTGHGFSGPVKRFGIHLRQHKSEKGQRKVGSIGPWHPSRVTFRVAMAGQHGFFTRTHYNHKIIEIGSGEKLGLEFRHYGKIKTNYLIIKGSVQGPPKRQLLFTMPLRETKLTKKKNYELVKILR